MKPLQIRDQKNGDKSKIVNHRWETICECLPKPDYCKTYKVTLNEMVFAWNETFGKGIAVETMLPANIHKLLSQKPPHRVYLVDGKEFHSFEAVEKYAHELGLRVILTQTQKDSNVYLVTLQK